MKVAKDFIFQPLVLVCMLNCTSPETTDTELVTAEVDPISKVELSVYCTELPFHIAIASPVLALEPLATVYLKNADVNDPVARVNKLFEPTTEELISA